MAASSALVSESSGSARPSAMAASRLRRRPTMGDSTPALRPRSSSRSTQRMRVFVRGRWVRGYLRGLDAPCERAGRRPPAVSTPAGRNAFPADPGRGRVPSKPKGAAQPLPRAKARPPVATPDTPLRCKSWRTEAILRMLENNLHNAEDPARLVVYGGTGKAARNPKALAAIKAGLQALGDDETLLVQSGKPVAIFRTWPQAPRVLIANSHLVPRWSTWEEFNRLEAEGLTMYGQMTAGSWCYIGTQGIIQGTYETFAAAGRKPCGEPKPGEGPLAGRIVLTGGLGGMGGAQPLAVTMAGGVCLAVEVDEARAQRRLDAGFLDVVAHDLPLAREMAQRAAASRSEERRLGKRG